jgi:mannose-1-phosphate guanylyltransferase
MTMWAAVLAGGAGTRFWPLSTAQRPKQFLTLASEQPLLVQAVTRLEGLVAPDRVLVVTARGLVDETRRLLPMLPPANVLGEPRPASTAPALAWATSRARAADPNAVVLSLHADWFVGDAAGFRDTAAAALDVADRHDVLVTVGMVPTRPETGYGYIEPGDPLDGQAKRVRRFVEKPDRTRAQALIQAGALWNSGLFAWRADRFFSEAVAHAPELAPYLATLESGDIDGFFASVTPIAVDVSHFERSDRVAVIPGAFAWDDVGTWAALHRVHARDEANNVLAGHAVAHDTEDCVLWAEEGAIVADGVRDLVIVKANGVTLVTTRDRAADLKRLLEHLPPELRTPSP